MEMDFEEGYSQREDAAVGWCVCPCSRERELTCKMDLL